MSSVDVFISYSTKDHVAAEEVVAHVERAGLRAWFAPRDVPVGAAYGEAIIKGVDGARALVLLLSSHSNASEQVAREVEHADKRRLPIFPLRLEEVVPEGSLAYFVSSVQFLDAWQPPLAPHLDRLVAGVRAKFEAAAESATAVPATSSASPSTSRPTAHPPKPSRAPLAIAAALTATVAAACGWYALRKPPADPPPIRLAFDYDLRAVDQHVARSELYLKQFGISVIDASENTSVNIVAKAAYYDGTGMGVDGGAADVLIQAGAFGPVSYTLVFAQPMKRVVLHRPALESIEAPDWTAHALGVDGHELSVVGEQWVNGPAPASEQTLNDTGGGGIYRVRVESNHQKQGTINAIALDGLTLYPMRASAN